MALPTLRNAIATALLLSLLALSPASEAVAQQQAPVTFSKQIAPKIDPATGNYPSLPVSYYYDPVMEEEGLFDGSLRVHLCLGKNDKIPFDQPLVAEVKLTDLSDSRHSHVRFVPLVMGREVVRGGTGSRAADDAPNPTDEAGSDENPAVQFPVVRYASFDLKNQSWKPPLLRPARVYRLFVNLHRQAESQGRQTLIGPVPHPYYTATTGATRLDRARRRIVMRTFKEFYYRQNGWRTGENYPMDCYAYYMWATGFCTVGAENGRTQLHNLFGKENSYNLGSHIPALSEQAPIHGDYVRMPGHSFMLLSYDAERGQVWTMEGNFNSTVEVVIRTVGSSWTVGHLRDGHILPSLFRLWQNRPRIFGSGR